jgi:hypothetical protein
VPVFASTISVTGAFVLFFENVSVCRVTIRRSRGGAERDRLALGE